MNTNDTVDDVCAEEEAPPASYYNGDLLSNWFYSVISFFCRVLTLDIAAPIVVCFRLRWRAEHTYLNGRRMVFTGKIGNLFAKNVLWVLLSVITIGIFLPFKMLKMSEWETEHFHFVGVPAPNDPAEGSKLDLKWYLYVWLKILTYIGNLFTLGIAYLWIYVYKERKFTEHTTIDGHKLEFHATVAEYFKKRVLWWVFSLLTLGLYSILLKGKILRWKISHTAVREPETVPFSEEVAAAQPLHPTNRRAYICFFLLFPIVLFLLSAWFSKVLCLHGAAHPISYIPFAIWLSAAAFLVVGLVTAAKAYRFSVAEHSAKPLSVGLIAVDSLLSAICLAILVVLILFLC